MQLISVWRISSTDSLKLESARSCPAPSGLQQDQRFSHNRGQRPGAERSNANKSTRWALQTCAGTRNRWASI